MTWKLISPIFGGKRRSGGTEGVTVAWVARGKAPAGGPRMRLRIYIRSITAMKTGWLPPKEGKCGPFRAEYNATTNQLRLAKHTHVTTKPGERGFSGMARRGAITIVMQMSHISADTRPSAAVTVPCTYEAPFLTMDLPDWARVPGMQAAAAARAAAVSRMAA